MKKLLLILTVITTFNLGAQPFEVGGQIVEIMADNELDIPYVNQTQSNWCWAASAAMVINYYKDTNVNSCSVASQEFNFNCCENPNPCNKQNSMDRFRFMVGNYNINTFNLEGRVNWETIKNQLDNDETMILRVESKFGGHFLVVFGYYEQFNHTTGVTAKMLDIYDPYLTYDKQFGEQKMFRINYDRLLSGFGFSYELNWTHTLRFKYWNN
jgi:hypothetical protein